MLTIPNSVYLVESDEMVKAVDLLVFVNKVCTIVFR